MPATPSLEPSAAFRELADPTVFATPPTFDLTSGLAERIERQRAVFTGLAGTSPGRLVIMGTGALGRILVERLQAFPVTVECFCDNDPAKQGGTLLGRPILSVADAVERYNGLAAFVVGIFHGHAAQEQLRRLHCQAVVSAATLCRHFGPPMTPLYSIDFPSAIYEQREEARRCADLWADEASRAEYRRVMQWFLADRQETLRGQGPAADTYFPRDLWQPDPAEHFVDCGAFDGDSIRCFLDRTDHQFRKVTAYEPDPRNIAACESHLAACSEADRQKIHLVKAAVGEQPGEVHFSDHGGVDSSVGGEGGLTVRCISLDEEHRVDPPTFLKMDIEGYEPSALRGGRAMITAHAPILAITLYHEVAHLWQIPLLLHSFRPDYQFYLRRYAEDCWETVCYAVPPHRVLPR